MATRDELEDDILFQTVLIETLDTDADDYEKELAVFEATKKDLERQIAALNTSGPRAGLGGSSDLLQANKPTRRKVVDITQLSIEDERKAFADLHQTRRYQHIEPTTDSSSTKDARVTDFHRYMNGIDPLPVYSRGRTPERVEHSRYSPQSGSTSRADSTSSVRSMIDERLEWAHQDRMRSASRDRSVPPSPFHENSPFYAEFVKDLSLVSPPDHDKSCNNTTPDLRCELGIQPRKCSRINSRSPAKRPEGRSPDIERALAVWAKNQEKKGVALSDESIRHKAQAFSATSNNPDMQASLSTSWLEKFKMKNNLIGAKSRKNSLAEDVETPLTGKPCNAIFSRPYDFTRHEVTIHNWKQCPLCPEEECFIRSETLARHMRTVHPEKSGSYWSCAAISKPEDVIGQIGPKLRICEYCHQLFLDSDDARIAEHLDQAHQFRKCDPSMKFHSREHFRQHLEETHAASSTSIWANAKSIKLLGDEEIDPSAMDTAAGVSSASISPTMRTVGPEEPQPQWSHLPARPTHICECCPKKPKVFETEDDLRVHQSMKPCYCTYCPSRFKSIDEVQRHRDLLHVLRHSWSCAALTDPQNAIAENLDGTSCCGYCGLEIQGHCIDDDVVAHLRHGHKFGDCNKAKKFFRADHFRQHLEHSHGAVPGILSDALGVACLKAEPPPPESSVAASGDSAQAPSALQSATTSMSRLSIPDGVPLPLPPPTYSPELSTTPCSDGHLVNHDDTANLGDSAAVTSSSNLSGKGLTSSGLSLGRSKRGFRLLDAESNDIVPHKRRMSSSVSESAGDNWLTSPAAVTESYATDIPMESPYSPPRSIAVAAEESKPEHQHVCSTCQRSFKKRTVLTNHERTHTGEKPFSCTFEGCSQAFAQQGDKTRHEKGHYKEKTFRCGNSEGESPSWGCKKKFLRKDGLLEHQKTTEKGKQCLAGRDKLMDLGSIGDEDSPSFE